MTTKTFRHPPEPFTAVQWTGNNLDEISGFLGFAPAVVSTLLSIPVSGGETAVVPVGWWVCRDALGIRVAAQGVAAGWIAA